MSQASWCSIGVCCSRFGGCSVGSPLWFLSCLAPGSCPHFPEAQLCLVLWPTWVQAHKQPHPSSRVTPMPRSGILSPPEADGYLLSLIIGPLLYPDICCPVPTVCFSHWRSWSLHLLAALTTWHTCHYTTGLSLVPSEACQLPVEDQDLQVSTRSLVWSPTTTWWP